MSNITGTIYQPAKVRPKVTYAYMKDSNGVKVDVVAFPTTPTVTEYLANVKPGQTVSLFGRVVENEKSRYALQFIADGLGNGSTAALEEPVPVVPAVPAPNVLTEALTLAYEASSALDPKRLTTRHGMDTARKRIDALVQLLERAK